MDRCDEECFYCPINNHLVTLSLQVLSHNSYICTQSKEEVMAVRLREADSMAAMAELRQKIAELEIQVNVRACVRCVCRHSVNS